MTPALGKWLGPGTIRGVWSPTLGTGPALPFWHWMWWTQFTVPPGDGTGVRQVTAGGRSTNATGVRHPCDVDDEPRGWRAAFLATFPLAIRSPAPTLTPC